MRQREDRSVGSDAQGKCDNGDDSKTWRATDLARPET
jgi:hypothetical protein